MVVMPIYEYQCNTCGHVMEAFQKISEKPLKKCPICNKSTLQKLVSAPSFQLKGTGWYVTDFRDKGKDKGEKTKKESENSSDAKNTGETKQSDSAAAGSNKESAKEPKSGEAKKKNEGKTTIKTSDKKTEKK